MAENRARTNFHPSVPTEGAPVYEQKELRSSGECRKARFCEWRGLNGRLIPPKTVQPVGTPVYEQKELRSSGECRKARFSLKGRCAVRMARAERTADST